MSSAAAAEAVAGGGQRGASSRRHAGDGVRAALEHPVDGRADRDAERQGDQRGEADASTGTVALPEPARRQLAGGERTGPADPSLAAGQRLRPPSTRRPSTTRTRDSAQAAGTLNESENSLKISVVKVW